MNRTGTPALKEGLMVWGNAGSYVYKRDYLDVVGSSPLVVSTNAACGHWILIRSGITANITLVNAHLDMSATEDGCPAILVERGATLFLTVKGTNTIRSGWGRAGIELDGSSLVISSKSTGSLIVSSDYGAGIGGGVASDDTFGGIVFINGGEVHAQGGEGSAGIGCAACLPGQRRKTPRYAVKIGGGIVCIKGGGRSALSDMPDLSSYRASNIVGSYDQETFEIHPLPEGVSMPVEVLDVSCVHSQSIPWKVTDDGMLHAVGFNDFEQYDGANHACVDVTYELDAPGSIAYRWKVNGSDNAGSEIFDRYWFLKGSDGTFLSGSDFLNETDTFNTHLIGGLGPGKYQLTLGVFCFGTDGSVSLDLSPCA